MSGPEFSRPLRTERALRGQVHEVVATPEECARLAQRMGIVAIRSLRGRFELTPEPGGVFAAHLRMTASVVQACVVTLEPFTADLAEDVQLRLVPEGSESEDDDPEGPDEIPYAGAVIDLGELAAEQLALALDPYPRRPDAALPPVEDTAPHPFAALRRLRGEE